MRAVIDLHCDTLTADRNRPCADSLNDSRAALSLSGLPVGVHWCQCFAIFIPDELDPAQSVAYYEEHKRSFHRQMEKFAPIVAPCRTAADIEAAWACGKTAALLTVENGSALAGDLDRVERLAEDGVVMMTLTWNGENELGSGSATDCGLTQFGRAAVRAMEDHGILVDVSHLNDRGFRDLLEVAQRPFVATHSNARSVCPHRRNLTDWQIREMAARRCLIGLNFYQDFLRDGGEAAPDDLLRHIDRFLELGAGDCLALGSDFDGAEVPCWLDSPCKEAGLRSLLLGRGYSGALAEKLMYRGALDFFHKNLG